MSVEESWLSGVVWMWIRKLQSAVPGSGAVMRKFYIYSLLLVFGSIVAWCQDDRVDGAASFTDVKSAVLRFTTEHKYSGWDEKIWNRSGDMAAVVIVKTIPDAQMASPNTLRDVLFILHEAWACPSRCIKSSSDRQPNVTMLLLEHLNANTRGPIQSEIDKTRAFILEQTRTAN
jgi:hypothetical protein